MEREAKGLKEARREGGVEVGSLKGEQAEGLVVAFEAGGRKSLSARGRRRKTLRASRRGETSEGRRDEGYRDVSGTERLDRVRRGGHRPFLYRPFFSPLSILAFPSLQHSGFQHPLCIPPPTPHRCPFFFCLRKRSM